MYPKRDAMLKITEEIMSEIHTELESGDIGEFMKSWVRLEKFILERHADPGRIPNVSSAIRRLRSENMFDSLLLNKIDSLRRFRNNLVHEPTDVSSKHIKHHIESLGEIIRELRIK